MKAIAIIVSLSASALITYLSSPILSTLGAKPNTQTAAMIASFIVIGLILYKGFPTRN